MRRVIVSEFLRLFAEGIPRSPLNLVDSKTSSTGVLILTYHPAATEEEG